MVSALENSGIEAVWDTVQEYKTKIEVHLLYMYIYSLVPRLSPTHAGPKVIHENSACVIVHKGKDWGYIYTYITDT